MPNKPEGERSGEGEPNGGQPLALHAAICSGEVPTRQKSRRTRIKENRAKRHRRRFYAVIGGKERARKTGVRKRPRFLPNVERMGGERRKTSTEETNENET
jgi:hypothetical protein